MVEQLDYQEINSLIKEYLQYHDMSDVLSTFQKEERQKINLNANIQSQQINMVPSDNKQLAKMPQIYTKFVEDKYFDEAIMADKNSEIAQKELQQRKLQKQHGSVLQSARQIFSIAINCLQQLHNIKDGNAMTDNLGETIDNYKIQLGKYNQILTTEGACDRSELFSEAVMAEHKKKLIDAKNTQNQKALIEVLLSLRVNALQISPELRKNLVYEIIRNDIFMINTKFKNQFLLDLLDISNNQVRHALLSLVSVVVSTLKGVEYILTNDQLIVMRIIQILIQMTPQQDGCVNQRFCIAILQKISIKQDSIPIFIDTDVVPWIISLIERSTSKTVSIFCLDFSTALLANILHSSYTAEHLEKDIGKTKQIMKRILNLLKSNIVTSVLMHLLICLSYLNKDRFQKAVEDNQFSESISEFVEYYSKLPIVENENDEIDKRTVLDLCAHMFHPKDVSGGGNELSQSLEYNDMKIDDKIREFENEQGDLIFECFQDEDTMFN